MLNTTKVEREFKFKAITPFDIDLKKTIDLYTSTQQTQQTRQTR
jgi:dTDP-D-glucose 4,6-dehydratase